MVTNTTPRQQECGYVLRAKSLSKNEYLTLAQQVAALCQQRSRLAIITSVMPIYWTVCQPQSVSTCRLLTCLRITTKKDTTKEKYLVISTHDADELRTGVAIVAQILSPYPPCNLHVVTSLNRRQWAGCSLLILMQQAKLPVYALGGMTHQDITQAQQFRRARRGRHPWLV
jgi:thiamine monophosphate synthase